MSHYAYLESRYSAIQESNDIHGAMPLYKLSEILTEDDLFILLLGSMNYQVENGGFQQYFDNGYAHGIPGFCSEKTGVPYNLAYLSNVSEIFNYGMEKEIHKEIKSILKQAKNTIRKLADLEDSFCSGYDEEYASLINDLDILDNEYYKYNDKMLRQVSKYFESKKYDSYLDEVQALRLEYTRKDEKGNWVLDLEIGGQDSEYTKKEKQLFKKYILNGEA